MSTISMVGGRLHGQSVDQIKAAAQARSRAMQRNKAKGLATPAIRPVIPAVTLTKQATPVPSVQVTPSAIPVSTSSDAVILPTDENDGVPKTVPWVKYGLIGGGVLLALKIFGGRGE